MRSLLKEAVLSQSDSIPTLVPIEYSHPSQDGQGTVTETIFMQKSQPCLEQTEQTSSLSLE